MGFMKRKIALVAGALTFSAVMAGFAYFSYFSQNEFPDESAFAASLDSESTTAHDKDPEPVSANYDLSAHQTLSRIVILIKENYVDPERIRPYDMFLAALDHIQKTVAEVVVDDSEAPKRIKISAGVKSHVFDLEKLGGLNQLWEVTLALRDIFRFLQTEITNPEDRRDIEYAAINGMLSTLDPHSVLLKPESFEDVKLSTKGEFGGLGIVISIRDGKLTVISPIEGTPASRAGVKAKDQIVKIGEESTVNMNLEEAVHRLRGKPGSKINIWILRKNWTEARRFTLTRAIIKIESVASELLDDGIGYVKIKNFQANTYDDLHVHLEKLRQKQKGELKGLVVDMRNNPGGLLDQAILIADRFIDKGDLVITVGEGNRKRDVKTAHQSGTEANYPIAVLVNGGSASASEIVSGALKNHDRAVVIGQQTFGKGSVQVLYDFKDRSALKLTIAQYLTPGDVSIQSVGITPDVQIVPASIAEKTKTVHLFVDDDSPREKDLDRHLDTPEAAQGKDKTKDAATRLVHLVAEEPSETEKNDEDESPDKFEYDFETRLAHDMLVRAPAGNRQDILKKSSDLFVQRTQDEQKRIADKLAGLGVDWSAGENKTNARVELQLQIAASPKGAIKPGSQLTLTATVRNSSDAPLHQLYGVSTSENPLLKNLEFVFGKVAPGQSKSWTIDVKLPQDLMPRADLLKVTLQDEEGKIKGTESSALVSIGDIPKPRFGLSYRIDDKGHGNGDGIPQVGETLDLKIDVRNLGAGKSEDTVVTLKNMESEAIFLNQGREKLGVIKPGGSASTTLKFTLRNALEKAEMRVSVWDAVLGEPFTEPLVLAVGDSQKVKADRQMVKFGGASVLYLSPIGDAPIIGQVKAGAVLKSDVVFGEWTRVQVDNTLSGFVKLAQVVAAGAGKKPTPNAVHLQSNQSAPFLDLDLSQLTTTDEVLHLRGSIVDEQSVKDMFIFVNDKKVYYKTLAGGDSTAQGVKIPLDVTLPLKLGSNLVAVVVRENNDIMSRRLFGVYRDQAKAIADREVAR